jgi:hypothetical protein
MKGMMFLGCMLAPCMNEVGNESKVMFLEHMVARTCLY